MKTVYLETELPTDAHRVWQAMQHIETFLYVCRGLFGVPALAGRTDPMREGESGSALGWAFHVIPAYRHHIHVERIDPETMTVRTHEHGGVLRTWNHTLHVEPAGENRCRYSDSIDIDAGPLTGFVAALATRIFRYRQRRWHKLVAKHLLPEGPAYARS